MAPVKPLTLSKPLLDPLQIVFAVPNVPPFDGASTVILMALEFASGHCPFFTMTRYHISDVSAPDVNVLFVLLIVVQGALPLGDDSHLWIAPVKPLTVNSPLFEPLQIVFAVPNVPPFDGASTVILIALEFVSEHCPFFTITRYQISEVRAPDVNVLFVLLIVVQGALPLGDDSHLWIAPVKPLTVNSPLFEPLQIVFAVP